MLMSVVFCRRIVDCSVAAVCLRTLSSLTAAAACRLHQHTVSVTIIHYILFITILEKAAIEFTIKYQPILKTLYFYKVTLNQH